MKSPCLGCSWWEGKCFRNTVDFNKCSKNQFVLFVAREEKELRKAIAWKCSSDGKHFATFKEKKCRYCKPVYDGEA